MSGEVTHPTEERNLPDPRTGESVDILRASTEQLADMMLGAGEVRRRLSEIEVAVGSEIVARLDKDATWTTRAGPFKISAPSPTAGIEEYPDDALEDALRELIDAGTISPHAATKALARRVAIIADVPWTADHVKLAAAVVDALAITIDDVLVTVVSAEPTRKSSKRGIADLRKVSGTAEILDRVKIVKDVGARKAKVERVSS